MTFLLRPLKISEVQYPMSILNFIFSSYFLKSKSKFLGLKVKIQGSDIVLISNFKYVAGTSFNNLSLTYY